MYDTPVRPETRAEHGLQPLLQSLMAPCLWAILDEIDYGVLLVEHDGQVIFANHAARDELSRPHPLQLQRGQVQASHPRCAAALAAALRAAVLHGLRRLLSVGEAGASALVAVVPLPAGSGGQAPPALLLLGKRRVCAQLSAQGYAASCGLTRAESAVLERLAEGLTASAIARLHGVGLSTVRTQIASLRTKTGADSIGELLHRVALLPPLVSALRSVQQA